MEKENSKRADQTERPEILRHFRKKAGQEHNDSIRGREEESQRERVGKQARRKKERKGAGRKGKGTERMKK